MNGSTNNGHISLATYSGLVAAESVAGKLDVAGLSASLESLWLSAYYDTCEHEPNVMQFTDGPFTFLYDHASVNTDAVEDRLVVGYGQAAAAPGARDASRIRGLAGGGLDVPGRGTFDKGHVLAHSMGGGIDVNLFPQRAELNRGRSPAGKVYRQMESYAAANPGVFVFSRLCYADTTWIPSSLEYGIVRLDHSVWVEVFDNK